VLTGRAGVVQFEDLLRASAWWSSLVVRCTAQSLWRLKMLPRNQHMYSQPEWRSTCAFGTLFLPLLIRTGRYVQEGKPQLGVGGSR